MKLTSDERCRIQSKDLFKPNTPYNAEKLADGRIVFVELVPKYAPRARLVRKGRRTFLVSENRLTNRDVAAALAQFP